MGMKLIVIDKRLSLIFIFFFGLLSQNLFSKTLLEPKDEFFVKKLEYQSFKKNILIDTTTFPIWTPPIEDSNESLIQIIENEFIFSNSLSGYFSSELNPLRGISDNFRDRRSISFSKEIVFDDAYIPEFNANISLTKNFSPLLDKKISLDGSYFSVVWPNYVLGIGYMERWWGPAHDNSLVLSNYAYSQPGIFFDSKSGIRFDNFLSFLGDINFSIFLNRLENKRGIKNSNLIGTRVTFQPNKNLTFGLSRVTMFGGENRPDSFEDFFNNLFRLTRSENGQDISNEIGGYDMKYNFSFNDILASFYFQLIGEDEIRFTPSKKIITLGNEFIYFENGLLRSFGLEYSNTIGEYGDLYNVIYEHSSYTSGYRYKNLPLGAFIDNDSIYLKFSSYFELTEDFSMNLSLFKGDFNEDKVGDKNIWGTNNKKFEGLDLKTKYKINKNLVLENIILVSTEEINFSSLILDKTTFSLKLTYNF